jgi:hypothetical protein
LSSTPVPPPKKKKERTELKKTLSQNKAEQKQKSLAENRGREWRGEKAKTKFDYFAICLSLPDTEFYKNKS